MTEAAAAVRTGEITTAIKDSKGKVGAIKAGQLIGIADHEIEVVGADVDGRRRAPARRRSPGTARPSRSSPGRTCPTRSSPRSPQALGTAHPELEIETHRGDQPLYPLIMAVE